MARESTTGYPFVPGSGLKGALSDAYGKGGHETFLFGTSDDGAGSLLVSDLRLLLLPVRSLAGVYRYVTCPHLLQRFLADLRRSREPDPSGLQGQFPALTDKQAAVRGAKGRIFLEEFAYEPADGWEEILPKIASLIEGLLGDEACARAGVLEKLAVVDDDSFAWFAENALPVRMRNSLDEQKRVKAGALWSEEYLPPDTVMYALIGHRGKGKETAEDADALLDALLQSQQNYLQLGGNETLGQGWFEVRPFASPAGGASS